MSTPEMDRPTTEADTDAKSIKFHASFTYALGVPTKPCAMHFSTISTTKMHVKTNSNHRSTLAFVDSGRMPGSSTASNTDDSTMRMRMMPSNVMGCSMRDSPQTGGISIVAKCVLGSMKCATLRCVAPVGEKHQQCRCISFGSLGAIAAASPEVMEKCRRPRDPSMAPSLTPAPPPTVNARFLCVAAVFVARGTSAAVGDARGSPAFGCAAPACCCTLRPVCPTGVSPADVYTVSCASGEGENPRSVVAGALVRAGALCVSDAGLVSTNRVGAAGCVDGGGATAKDTRRRSCDECTPSRGADKLGRRGRLLRWLVPGGVLNLPGEGGGRLGGGGGTFLPSPVADKASTVLEGAGWRISAVSTRWKVPRPSPPRAGGAAGGVGRCAGLGGGGRGARESFNLDRDTVPVLVGDLTSFSLALPSAPCLEVRVKAVRLTTLMAPSSPFTFWRSILRGAGGDSAALERVAALPGTPASDGLSALFSRRRCSIARGAGPKIEARGGPVALAARGLAVKSTGLATSGAASGVLRLGLAFGPRRENAPPVTPPPPTPERDEDDKALRRSAVPLLV